MTFITTSVKVPAPIEMVRAAVTTTAGHRGWWWDNCEVGSSVGDQAVYRTGPMEAVFHIDRLDEHGLEMTCVRTRNCAEWEGTRLTLRVVEDGSGTYVDLMHEGWRARTPFFDACAAGWAKHLGSLPAYLATGRGAPFVASQA